MNLPSKINNNQPNNTATDNLTSFWEDDVYGLKTTDNQDPTSSGFDYSIQDEWLESSNSSPTFSDDYSQILFIDSAVPDSQTLIDNISGATDVVVLNQNEDEIVQISEHLDNYQQLDAVHIVSLGESGQLSFAKSELNSDTLGQYTQLLKSWRKSLDVDADIVLYGCDVSSLETGNSFVQQLSQTTGADVLASVDKTGVDGDWELETDFGSVEASSVFDPSIATAYQHTLDVGEIGIIPDSGVDFGDGVSDTGVDFKEADPNDLLLLPDVDIDSDGENFKFPELGSGDIAEFDFKNVPAEDLEILTTEEGLSFSEFKAEDLAELDLNNIPAENIKIMADAGLDLKSYPDEFVADVQLSLVENVGYVSPDIFSTTSLSPDTTFGELSATVVANANLYDYKGENLNLDDGFSLSETEQLDFNDYKALDFAFDGDSIFDSESYLQNNPDIAESGINPFTHYFNSGAYAPEFRDPTPYFDSEFYLQNNPDVAESGINPLFQYFNSGAKAPEFRDPDPAFDTSFYLEDNPDVAEDGINPLFQYFNSGASEGRYANETFKTLEESGQAFAISTDISDEDFELFKDDVFTVVPSDGQEVAGVGILLSPPAIKAYIGIGLLTLEALRQANSLQEALEGKIFWTPVKEPLNDGGNVETVDPDDVDTGTEPFDLGESIVLDDRTFIPPEDFLDAILDGRYEFPDDGEGGSYFLAIEGFSEGIDEPTRNLIGLSDVDEVIDSASRPSKKGSETSRGLQALQKRLDLGNPAYAGFSKTEEDVEQIIEETLGASNTSPIIETGTNRNQQSRIDVFNSATGRGVRFVNGKFDTFVNLK